MIRGMLAALAMLGAVFFADAAVAEGPVCATNPDGRKLTCTAGTFCCKVPSQLNASGYNCCHSGDRCVAGKGCFVQVSLRPDSTWGSAQRKSELQVLRDLLTEIPDKQGTLKVGEAFKRFVDSDVTLVRVSRPSSPRIEEPVLGVTPGVLDVRDAFFRMASKTEQTNVLTFELAKVLWYKINGTDTSNARTEAGQKFVALLNEHRSAMSVGTLKAAALDQKELATLGDSDLQSQFSYAARVALLDLAAPAGASPAASGDWVSARNAMRQYMMSILK